MATTTPFLITSEVAARLRCSVRTVHELTRLGLIPHRRLPGARRCLFRVDELQAWEDGARLETIELGDAARLVRPVSRPASRPRPRHPSSG
jgi:excisionase family DNA binding protein